MSTPQSLIYGKQPPFVRSFRVNPHRSNGKNEKEVTIEYVVLLENRSEFIDSLPYTLSENSLTPIFSAEDIATHGIISSAYSGLDLQGVQESGEGRLRTLTITYASPQDLDSEDSSSNYSYSWWSSSGTGKIYHERARINISQSETYAQNAMRVKYNLSPNGANISPESDGIHATYEASWGPNDEDDIDEEEGSSGSGSGGGDDSEDEEESVTDTVSFSTSTEVICPSIDCIAQAMGMWGGDLATSHGGGNDILRIAALIESGQVVYKTHALNGTGGWYYASQDPANSMEFNPGYGFSVDDVLAFSKMVNSQPSVSVPKMTVSIRRYVKSQSAKDITSSAANIGSASNTIKVGGVNLPSPAFKAPAPFDQCPLTVQWVFCGTSTDSAVIAKRYSANSNNTKLIYGTYVTDTYTTQASFGAPTASS